MIGLIVLISPIYLSAHNSLSAKYYLNVNEQVSLLSIHLSQVGVHAMMKKQYGDQLEDMSVTEYKEALVSYVKTRCDLFVGDQKIILNQGGIKLGSHQTDLKFLVEVPSIARQNMSVSIPAFKENDLHQTVFAYNINGVKGKAILSQKNDYQSDIIFNKSLVESKSSWLLFSIIAVLAMVSLFLYLMKKNFFNT